MIKLANLKKSYNKLEVLKGIDLLVQTGEVMAVLGPSGSGKSTLLRCINFLDKADEGVVTIGSTMVPCDKPNKRDVLQLRRKTAMVFQNYNLFRHKTALENVMEGLIVAQKQSKSAAKEKAKAVLEKVGLADKLDSYPSQLSGGQQQRVGIARALVLEPEIILFDEPTSALDPERVGEVLTVIRNIAKEGITMMIVTHELNFAREVANRVIFMTDGEIIEEGSPETIFSHPKEALTRQFFRRFINDYSYSI
ncbi:MULTISPECIES: amino acid ABC transporter ATP-binding protein [unclassified Paenibacillus]|uniref:amino acid ABC transporter ATP-binding protein n=1 Tax=unclassified Paenibacillus TaxID=185978 RepID=UPI00070A8D4F|nr:MULTISPECIES: amino acid ABC transporter ATP-binding protein [unclassified Paenibacillus]KQX48939.1 amino acid ABC transporter ATP-binding protein [Paenibacillus sp. Root444D2]KRE36558.1 amino acid ABC transporter ATP-binding protein [Paenibacillus sp. Soil724D2]